MADGYDIPTCESRDSETLATEQPYFQHLKLLIRCPRAISVLQLSCRLPDTSQEVLANIFEPANILKMLDQASLLVSTWAHCIRYALVTSAPVLQLMSAAGATLSYIGIITKSQTDSHPATLQTQGSV